MRVFHIIILFIALAAAHPSKHEPGCGELKDLSIPEGVDPLTIPPQVCDAPSTPFEKFSKPIRQILNKFFERRHADATEKEYMLMHYPWSITNTPSYGNYTPPDDSRNEEGGWNIHAHGYLYKRRTMLNTQVDDLVNRILIRASIRREKFYKSKFDQLGKDEADQARRQAKDLATLAIERGAIGASFPAIYNQSNVLHTLTNDEGAFDEWLAVPKPCNNMTNDECNEESEIVPSSGIYSTDLLLQPLNVPGIHDQHSNDKAKAFFLPPRGLTIVSDVDDVLRVAEVWNWKQAVLDLFARPYNPWLGMAEVYSNWSRDIPLGGGGHWKDGG